MGACIAFALCLSCVGVSHAQPLEHELKGLIKDNPEILARQKEVESAREGVDVAISGFLPRVDATGEIGPEHINSPLTDQGEQDWTETRQLAGVKLTQNIFDGFSTPAEVKTARLDLEVAEFTFIGTRQNILFEGIRAYVGVLRHVRLVELSRLQEETIKVQLNLEDERVKRGAGIAVDVLQAKSRLQLAKERRVAFEGALEDAISRYIQLFNHAPDLANLVDPVPPTELLPEDLELALQDRRGRKPGHQ